MAVDRTLLFKASVKTVKTRNKAIGIGYESSKEEIFKRSRPKSGFSPKAKEVVSLSLPPSSPELTSANWASTDIKWHCALKTDRVLFILCFRIENKLSNMVIKLSCRVTKRISVFVMKCQLFRGRGPEQSMTDVGNVTLTGGWKRASKKKPYVIIYQVPSNIMVYRRYILHGKLVKRYVLVKHNKGIIHLGDR